MQHSECDNTSLVFKYKIIKITVIILLQYSYSYGCHKAELQCLSFSLQQLTSELSMICGNLSDCDCNLDDCWQAPELSHLHVSIWWQQLTRSHVTRGWHVLILTCLNMLIILGVEDLYVSSNQEGSCKLKVPRF